MLTRPGQGVPGIHGGDGDGVGTGVGWGVGGDGLRAAPAAAGVGERVAAREGDGIASWLLGPQAIRSVAAAKHGPNAAARRVHRTLRGAARRLAATVGVVRQRMNIAGSVLGSTFILLRITLQNGRTASGKLLPQVRYSLQRVGWGRRTLLDSKSSRAAPFRRGRRESSPPACGHNPPSRNSTSSCLSAPSAPGFLAYFTL
jgi:hypothetical protein